MSEDFKDVAKAVREMAHLSILNDKLNPIQEKNLKMYPFVFFNGVTGAEIEYNISNRKKIEVEEDEKTLDVKYTLKKPETGHFKVVYNLEIDEKVENSHLEKRFKALKDAVTGLLWSDMLVEIKFNDRTVYKSK